MVPSISRQSVILKCLRRKSVLLGNYEMYYAAGLMKKMYNLNIDAGMQPQELYDAVNAQIKNITAEDEKEKHLIQMMTNFEPLAEYDEDMVYLFRWGFEEPDVWQVNTNFEP